jgi:release factor glutamine methyltransferase
MPNEKSEPWTVLRLIDWTKDHFAKVNMEDPRLSAEVLLAHVLRCRRIDLYARYNVEPAPEQLEAYRELVKKAAAYQPIAYLIGEKEFYSLRFKITPDVLVPRSETEMLVTEAVTRLRRLGRPGRMWDACTGSGCVAIAAAMQVHDAHVLATDISPAAMAVAEENAAAHKVGQRLRCRVADLLALPDDCRDLVPFDVITANPPYVADNQMISETVRHEPTIAIRGGSDGLDFLRPIIAAAPDLLCKGGALILEFGFAHADGVRDIIVATGRFSEPRILRDHQEIERAAVSVKK